MTAGKGPEPPLVGSWTLAEKLELRPFWLTLTVMLELETVPVTLDGFAGLSPYTKRSASRLISSRRQRQSALVVIRVPSSFLNGSGIRVLVDKDPSLGRVTGQSAPSSSTPTAAVASVKGMATAPAAVSV